tara:strand:- start:104 stop:277 length:174 start_codon:yes stop_codon:yes gene_type:complete
MAYRKSTPRRKPTAGSRTSKPAKRDTIPYRDRDKLDPKHKAKRPKKKTTSKRPRKKY